MISLCLTKTHLLNPYNVKVIIRNIQCESNYKYVHQKLLVTLEKRKMASRLKITALNKNLRLLEKVAYIKAFSSEE